MNTRYFASMLFVGIILSACSGTASTAAAVIQNPTTSAGSGALPMQQTPRTISVSGEGKAEGVPDIAMVNLGVETRDADVTKAVADNNQKAKVIAQAVLAMGVDAKDIQTSNYSVSYQDVYDNQGQSTGQGKYYVSNTVAVTVHDLSKLGQILGNALAAGANSVYDVAFTVADPTPLYSEARAKAIVDAQARAGEIAKGFNVEIVRVLSVNEGGLFEPPTTYSKNAMAAGGVGGGPVPIQSGSFTVTMQLSVVYEIK